VESINLTLPTQPGPKTQKSASLEFKILYRVIQTTICANNCQVDCDVNHTKEKPTRDKVGSLKRGKVKDEVWFVLALIVGNTDRFLYT